MKISGTLPKNLRFLYTVDKRVKYFLAQQEDNGNPLLRIYSNDKISLLLTKTSNSIQIKNSWGSMTIIVTRNNFSFSAYTFSSRRGPGFKSPEYGYTAVRSCYISLFFQDNTKKVPSVSSRPTPFTSFSTHYSALITTLNVVHSRL